MNIRIQDLFYIYESNSEKVVALRGLHLNVQSGECLVIKGPNGSGKSTLVKLLTGYYTPTAGKIFIDDMNISDIDPLRLRREFIASIDQRGNLINEITVLENLALGYSLAGASHTSSVAQSEKILENHGLTALSGRSPDQLSSGERQFVSLLAAVATNPKVLVADEPSGELDNESAEIIYSLLKSLAGATTVILVTHDARAEQFADRVVRIRDGRISEEWVPGEAEDSVVDPFGWKRVQEILRPIPKRNLKNLSATKTTILSAKNIGLKYGDKRIFADINIEGNSGEFIILQSSFSSGSGKSSLLRIFCGIQEPSEGVVHIKEHAIQELDRAARADLRNEMVGYLSQRGGALQNISLGEYLRSTPVELGGAFALRMNHPLSAFSGGERARIELLKLVAESKPILLLDEPTSQMDEHRSREAAEILFEYVDRGGLIIASTRDDILLGVANQIINLQPTNNA